MKKRNFIGFVKNVLLKLVVLPFKYGKNGDYDASRYWDDRLRNSDDSVTAVGVESLSHEDNLSGKIRGVGILRDTCIQEEIDFNNVRLLEIGSGNGIYTEYLHGAGLKQYCGLDITDALFSSIEEKCPGFEFVKKDISSKKLNREFDVIIMISVIQHIVSKDKFHYAINNILNNLSDDGVFFITHIYEKAQKRLFHVRHWSIQELEIELDGFQITNKIPFGAGYMLVIRKSK